MGTWTHPCPLPTHQWLLGGSPTLHATRCSLTRSVLLLAPGRAVWCPWGEWLMTSGPWWVREYKCVSDPSFEGQALCWLSAIIWGFLGRLPCCRLLTQLHCLSSESRSVHIIFLNFQIFEAYFQVCYLYFFECGRGRMPRRRQSPSCSGTSFSSLPFPCFPRVKDTKWCLELKEDARSTKSHYRWDCIRAFETVEVLSLSFSEQILLPHSIFPSTAGCLTSASQTCSACDISSWAF